MEFPARYSGVCSACASRIEVGDLIRRSEEGSTYEHVDCEDPTPPPPRPTKYQGTTLDQMGY